MKAKYLFLFILTTFSFTLYAQINRPQEPKEPFKYTAENVKFKNNFTDSITLAGTLTYPKEGANFPAVILISGSGPQDRNSEIMNHKPFLVIADYLTKNGIVVLRLDDRGTGESAGNYNETGLNGFVNDTKSALEFLKSRKEVNHTKIGLIGHSMGGVIAPIVASENPDISFIVLLAGSGIRGDQLMLLQKEKIEQKMGVPELGIIQGQNNMKGAYDIILKSDKNKAQLQAELKDYFTSKFGEILAENQIQSISEQLSFPWLTDLIKFDPQTSLSKTNCPVLALNGANDLQVPAKENLENIERILKESGNKDVEVIEFENLNHLFQESETGLPNEYATIEQTFSPKVLETMTRWIKKQTE